MSAKKNDQNHLYQTMDNTPSQEGYTNITLRSEYLNHPMFPVLMAALEQQIDGKGKERHGQVPYEQQRIFTVAQSHGLGFITGQAEKKLGEAAAGLRHARYLEAMAANRSNLVPKPVTHPNDAFEKEVLGAIVYAATAVVAMKKDFPV